MFVIYRSTYSSWGCQLGEAVRVTPKRVKVKTVSGYTLQISKDAVIAWFETKEDMDRSVALYQTMHGSVIRHLEDKAKALKAHIDEVRKEGIDFLSTQGVPEQ